jgi:pantetheine-phosphate adenylyltransferase
MRSAIYPGTFDPVTLGHIDLVERGLRLFDSITVAVADSGSKGPLFSLARRVEMFREATKHLSRVSVTDFNTLTVSFAREKGAVAVIRGLRAISDYDYEFQLAWMNRKIEPSIETVFLCPNAKYSLLNATLVKEIARLGGDVSEFVPSFVADAIYAELGG